MTDALGPLLSIRDVHVRFGGLKAVTGASMDCHSGIVTSLIGPNGAGKTTLFNVVTGTQPPASGEVFLDGEDITRLPAHRRAQRGWRGRSSASRCSRHSRCTTTSSSPPRSPDESTRAVSPTS